MKKFRAYSDTIPYGMVIIFATVTIGEDGERIVNITRVAPIKHTTFDLLRYERETGLPCGFNQGEINNLKKVVLNFGEEYECQQGAILDRYLRERRIQYRLDDKMNESSAKK